MLFHDFSTESDSVTFDHSLATVRITRGKIPKKRNRIGDIFVYFPAKIQGSIESS